RDLKWELLRPVEPGTERASATPVRPVPWMAATAVLVLLSLSLGWLYLRGRSQEPLRVERFSLLTPDKANFNSLEAIPAISPDGRHVAFALSIDGQSSLWIRDLDALTAQMVPGTVGAAYPFWSPDSRWIAF